MYQVQTNNASFANTVCKVNLENTMHSAFANAFVLQCRENAQEDNDYTSTGIIYLIKIINLHSK